MRNQSPVNYGQARRVPSVLSAQPSVYPIQVLSSEWERRFPLRIRISDEMLKKVEWGGGAREVGEGSHSSGVGVGGWVHYPFVQYAPVTISLRGSTMMIMIK